MPNPSSGDRVAVVTGGARGIGLAAVRWFLDRAYHVAILDVAILDGDEGTLPAAAEALERPERLLALRCDVSDPHDVEAAAAAVAAKWGRVDALVNNAGVAVFKPALETSFAEWRQVMATNLDGAFLCTQAFGAAMKAARRGSIVNVASISGLRASTMRVAYGTSKAALVHMTKQYAVELGTFGIRVNAVCPGPVETEMAKLVHTPAIRSDYHDAIPLGRYGSVEEMASLIGFLSSDEAGYLNGQCIANDGGFDAAGVGIPTFRRDLGLNDVGGAAT